MNYTQFIIGMLIGIIIGGFIAWGSYRQELQEWKELFKEILPQLTGYKNLKDRMK